MYDECKNSKLIFTITSGIAPVLNAIRIQWYTYLQYHTNLVCIETQKFGTNVLPPAKKKSFCLLFALQFIEPSMILVEFLSALTIYSMVNSPTPSGADIFTLTVWFWNSLVTHECFHSFSAFVLVSKPSQHLTSIIYVDYAYNTVCRNNYNCVVRVQRRRCARKAREYEC